MIKLLVGAVLILTASSALADNIFIYKDNNQQALTASDEVEGNVFIYENSNQSGNFDKFTKKVTYYDKGKAKQTISRVSHGTSSNSNSSSYANSAYDALR